MHVLTTIPHELLAGSYPLHLMRRQRWETVFTEAAPWNRGSFSIKRGSCEKKIQGKKTFSQGGGSGTLQGREGDRLQSVKHEGATGKRVAPFFYLYGRIGRLQ
jgi:hypothetical protein